ncbi:MAG TPA: 1,4-dihydroxy-6-naphthoate synthase [Pirellulaceae bacterium]|nr:1,4-dihydroxy-6-naphthoate synthase [Pirellulaceae bacterium]HMO94138.1 1,4-dihydroxy-6-naphthoate synthase [Pirellulaceae bacterium]HMP71209.1 1,4-dihydroxy-6-naphthoate synthase [Pirellulaceae bacterium]
MPDRVHLGISTCPNDTFAFHAILQQRIDTNGIDFHVELKDVQELNLALLAGRYDVGKASFHAALRLTNEMVVLPSGSALGFGVGPVLLSHQSQHSPEQMTAAAHEPTVLCPGELTTASMLYRIFHQVGRIEQVVFSEIMPRLEARDSDFGVCIHEGRFSYQDHGLFLIEDLGTTWEHSTSSPLPLGGILARKSLGHDLLERIQTTIRDSIEYALNHRQETVATMKAFAQELNDEILFAHVDLYVNDWTIDLGQTGREAIRRLEQIAIENGLIAYRNANIEILESQRTS